MSLTTTPTNSPAILNIIYNGNVNVGQALHDIDGLWKYCPSSGGWIESHNLREIAALLDGLNAPHEQELAAYFDSLPKEIDRTPRHDDTPF